MAVNGTSLSVLTVAVVQRLNVILTRLIKSLHQTYEGMPIVVRGKAQWNWRGM